MWVTTIHAFTRKVFVMLPIIIAVVAVILLFTGGFVQSLQFLLWVGIVCLIISAVMFIMRSMSGHRSA